MPVFVLRINFLLNSDLTCLDQIKGLCGCDLLTINPKLLEELEKDHEPIYEQLTEASGKFLI